MHGVLGTVQRIRQRLRGNGSWLWRWPTKFWGQKGWRSGVGMLLGMVTLWLVSHGMGQGHVQERTIVPQGSNPSLTTETVSLASLIPPRPQPQAPREMGSGSQTLALGQHDRPRPAPRLQTTPQDNNSPQTPSPSNVAGVPHGLPDSEGNTWIWASSSWVWGGVMAMVGLVGWLGTWVWRWRQRWDTVRKQLERRQGEIVSLQRHIADHEYQRQTDQTQIQDLRTTLAQLEQQIGENQTAYEAQILQQAHKIDQLKLTLQEQRNDTAYLKLLEESNGDLQAQLHQLKRQDEDYIQALQALKNQTDVLQAEKDALTDQLRAVRHKLQMCQWQQDHSQGSGEGPIDPHLRGQMPYRLVITKNCQKDLAHQGNGKDYRQLVEHIFLLQENPRPQDSRPLNKYGLRGVFSVDAGEYRIAYRVEDFAVGGGEVELIMVDKRNDDCIYDRLRRALPQHF